MAKLTNLSDLGDLFGHAPEPERQTDSMKGSDRATAMVTLDVRFEKKGRKGAGATVVRGFYHTKDDLERLAKLLKSACGAGGTVKGETIEIQGDHRQKVGDLLKQEGFTVKVIRS